MEQYIPKRRNIKSPKFLKPNHSSCLPAYEDGTECSETSEYKIHTPGNYPEESIQQKYLTPFERPALEAGVCLFLHSSDCSGGRSVFPPCRHGNTHAELIDAYGMGHKR